DSRQLSRPGRFCVRWTCRRFAKVVPGGDRIFGSNNRVHRQEGERRRSEGRTRGLLSPVARLSPLDLCAGNHREWRARTQRRVAPFRRPLSHQNPRPRAGGFLLPPPPTPPLSPAAPFPPPFLLPSPPPPT